jgi:uncharacterized coiled-coil protein SlyX
MGIEQRVSDLENRVTSLESRIIADETRLSSVESRLATDETRITQLEGKVTAVNEIVQVPNVHLGSVGNTVLFSSTFSLDSDALLEKLLIKGSAIDNNVPPTTSGGDDNKTDRVFYHVFVDGIDFSPNLRVLNADVSDAGRIFVWLLELVSNPQNVSFELTFPSTLSAGLHTLQIIATVFQANNAVGPVSIDLSSQKFNIVISAVRKLV